jgi:hypothetical protein
MRYYFTHSSVRELRLIFSAPEEVKCINYIWFYWKAYAALWNWIISDFPLSCWSNMRQKDAGFKWDQSHLDVSAVGLISLRHNYLIHRWKYNCWVLIMKCVLFQNAHLHPSKMGQRSRRFRLFSCLWRARSSIPVRILHSVVSFKLFLLQAVKLINYLLK